MRLLSQKPLKLVNKSEHWPPDRWFDEQSKHDWVTGAHKTIFKKHAELSKSGTLKSPSKTFVELMTEPPRSPCQGLISTEEIYDPIAYVIQSIKVVDMGSRRSISSCLVAGILYIERKRFKIRPGPCKSVQEANQVPNRLEDVIYEHYCHALHVVKSKPHTPWAFHSDLWFTFYISRRKINNWIYMHIWWIMADKQPGATAIQNPYQGSKKNVPVSISGKGRLSRLCDFLI